ncbi:hypothetical protein KXD40_006019 [Peronospora effusa]|uniref:RxLR effector protein n=1 Tax=Peronospora effusa TaxID=542832 RepID=A0A3M6VE98_9STRA|nr:hypothetical protein DD238_004657 [Peronospora effusa]UIZ25747.1 hypothetical protein KXD40_006019 [Peronospora effusa]CAI5706993.1 unnamed protein product [Peronospora effusa]
MRTYPLLLVAAATLSALSSTRSSSSFKRLAPSHQHPPQRFLRDGTEATEEERVPDFLKTPFDSLMKKIDEARMAASIMKHKKLFFQSTGDNLLNNPSFIEFCNKIIQRHKKANPERAIAKVLVSHYADDDLLIDAGYVHKGYSYGRTRDEVARWMDRIEGQTSGGAYR